MIKIPVKRTERGFLYTLKYVDSQNREHEVTISSLAGALLEYKVDSKAVVVSFVDQQNFTTIYSGMVLLPFPNRLEDGIYDYQGIKYSTFVNEINNNNNLHAFSIYQDFELIEQSTHSITLALRLPMFTGYPFDIYTEVTYILGDDGLTVSSVTKNLGSRTAPWGIGFHPWFSVRGQYADAALQVQAKSRVEVNQRMLPVKEVPVDGKYNLQELQNIGDNCYDDAFLDFINSSDQPAVVLVGADGHKTYVYADENLPVFQICTRTDNTEFGEQNTVAIEPSSCYANAFKTGRLLVDLEPDQEHRSEWRIDFN